jgi:hypothetical protein
MADFFQFEADFVESLRCIPLQVRLKLDTCGVKLKLQDWLKFTQDERQALVVQPCTTTAEAEIYRQQLQQLVSNRSGSPAAELPIEPHPIWNDSSIVSPAVAAKAEEFGVTLTVEKWANLTPLQRFALIKLSRSSHENSNFLPALQEFQLV